MTDGRRCSDFYAKEKVQIALKRSLELLRKYDWLVNSYVLDFYINNHWNKLPGSWRVCLEPLQPDDLSEVLLYQPQSRINRVWPLSLIVLKQLLADLCIDRTPKYIDEIGQNSLIHDKKLKYLFTKCVKSKKRHEIHRMAGLCNRISNKFNVDFILDFGAGLGHLARVLGYNYGIQVCCLEMQEAFNKQAIQMDKHLECVASKHLSAATLATFRRPIHVTLKLNADTRPNELLKIIKTSLKLTNNEFRFGIIGLHPCGDLGAILMRMLLNCPQAQFLMFVGCCYMKLSTMSDKNGNIQNAGYPLSYFMHQKPNEFIELSYEAREISCHASEVYYDRLCKGDYEHLKVHSYRATAERIIAKNWPMLRHCGLRSVKHTPGLKFQDYFYKAIQGLPIAQLPLPDLESTVIENDLMQWKRIVIFYTLRLMFAPLVESIILYDRVLYLLENGCEVNFEAMFDPRLSPRNYITTAVKKV